MKYTYAPIAFTKEELTKKKRKMFKIVSLDGLMMPDFMAKDLIKLKNSLIKEMEKICEKD